MKKTPLYEEHVKLGGKIVDFGGWALPVQYSGIVAEHTATRERAGLFDVSHMGEIMVEGADAEAFLQYLITNDISHSADFAITYSPMCYENGFVVDDLLVYRYNKQKYLLVVNAANTDKDFAYIQEHLRGDVRVENISDQVGQLALQGPQAEAILAPLCKGCDLSQLAFYHFYPEVDLAGKRVLISRTGYTGEDGFEIYCAAADAPELWQLLLHAGEAAGLLPAGLGARDTLRFEAGLPLYGHEISETISPLEGMLGIFVKKDKPMDYLGKEALAKARETGLQRKLVGLEMVGRGIPRDHYKVLKDGQEVGFVTSGSFSPTTGKNLALAIVQAPLAVVGESLDVVIREKPVEARVVARPFVQKNYKK